MGIARAVVNRPSIILADEPTGNLDPALSAEVMKIFQQFQSVGVCLLVASHDTALMERLNYRTLVLNRGKLLVDQKPGPAGRVTLNIVIKTTINLDRGAPCEVVLVNFCKSLHLA